MPYMDLIRNWHQAVQAVDRKEWNLALDILENIPEPTSKIFFTMSSIYLQLGYLEKSIEALNKTVEKDNCLAVGFFQRAAVHMLTGRLEQALSDCSLALKNQRGNPVIDYRQLGLRFKLHNWEVLYNTAAVYSQLGQWDKALEVLEEAIRQKQEDQDTVLQSAKSQILHQVTLKPLLIPKGEIFRPKQQDVEQLDQRDFLGKPRVISSILPDDDFAGFEALRPQKPGFYEPETYDNQEPRYFNVISGYSEQSASELQVQPGDTVFMLDQGQQGRSIVIHDGKKGLLPTTCLQPMSTSELNKKLQSGLLKGIPLPRPPGHTPPGRPQTSAILPPLGKTLDIKASSLTSRPPEWPSPPYGTAPGYQAMQEQDGHEIGTQRDDAVLMEVHYTSKMEFRIHTRTSYVELQDRIKKKLQQQLERLHLRVREVESLEWKPVTAEASLKELWANVEGGKIFVKCQHNESLSGRKVLYQAEALYDYSGQGPEDLDFIKGDIIDILSEVNEDWLEGHIAGHVGIFPRCFVTKDVEITNKETENHVV
ncbi:NADPH oxidase activator 1-like isoform X1 [Erpetoichthys calabaricus]|uniref:NADPH oxidase activator 1-like n=1 Tax=Erpetoichthys calabaricus TaxID=27687 RepID=A0A8C4SR19_ERPCA|nr:NADPH oxidase activator 1-like isoform X1 [Erpetoichthys calabaricus]